MFMMAWKRQKAIICHSLNPPPPASCESTAMHSSNEQIIQGSFVPGVSQKSS